MALWTPTQLGTILVAFWEADSITGLADGDPVDSWTDQTINARAATASSTARPILKIGVQNGHNVVRFDGSNDRMSTASTTFGISAQPWSAFAVWSGTAGSANDACFQCLPSGALYFDTAAGTNLFGSAGSGQSVSLSSKGSMSITGATFNGASGILNANGTRTTKSMGTGTPNGVCYLGDNSGGSYYLAGDIACVLIINAALTTTQWQLLEGWSAFKYGLTSLLPSDHPYKSSPPTSGRSGLRYPLGAGLRNRTLRG